MFQCQVSTGTTVLIQEMQDHLILRYQTLILKDKHKLNKDKLFDNFR